MRTTTVVTHKANGAGNLPVCRTFFRLAFDLLAIGVVASVIGSCGSGSDSSSGSGRRLGNKIVYVSTYSAERGPTGEPVTDAFTQVYAINPDGTGQERLLQTAENVTDYSPSFSADGSRVAYLSSRDGCGIGGCRRNSYGFVSPLQIWVSDTDGSRAKRLTSYSDAPPFRTLSFSPGGSKILYTETDGTLLSVSADGGEPVQVAQGVSFDSATFSPDGSKILYEEDSSFQDGIIRTRNHELDGRDIYTMNADGTGRTLLASGGFSGVFSRDGSRIIFLRSSTPPSLTVPRGRLWVMNADGSGQKQLTDDGDRIFRPSFSPDGTRIVFQGLTDSERFALFVMNADGTNETRVPIPKVPTGNTPRGAEIISRYAWR